MTFDWIHLHLMVNHFPVVLGVVGAGGAVLALLTKRDVVATYAAVTLVLAGLSAPMALLTGDQAEDEAEKVWFVTEDAIHEHEERAELAMWLSIATGVLAAVSLVRPNPRWRLGASLLALIAAGAMGAAAFEGGKIVHDNPRLEKSVGSGVNP